MGVIEIVSGIVLILCSIFIVVITLMQSQKQQGITMTAFTERTVRTQEKKLLKD